MGRVGAGGKRGVNCNLAAVPAHHLDQKQPLGRVGGVADLVDRFRGGADGTGEANADVGAREIVVDRPRTSDDPAFPEASELAASAECAVAADGYQVVDLMSLEHVGREPEAFLGPESLAAAGVQDRTAAMDDARHAAQVHLVIVAVERIVKIFVQEPLVAAPDADDVIAERKRSAHHRADTGIHARGIPAASEYADTHRMYPPAAHSVAIGSATCSVLVEAVEQDPGPREHDPPQKPTPPSTTINPSAAADPRRGACIAGCASPAMGEARIKRESIPCAEGRQGLTCP